MTYNMLWAWDTTARYMFKGCRKMVLTIPMSQSVDEVFALTARMCPEKNKIIVEGVFVPKVEKEDLAKGVYQEGKSCDIKPPLK